MMKKLLVLILVLCMASAASAVYIEAGPTLPVLNIIGDDETIGVSVYLSIVGGTINSSTMYYTGNQAAIGVETDGGVIAFINGVVGLTANEIYFVEFQGTDIPLPVLSGLLADFDAGVAGVKGYLLDDEGALLGNATTVPEPATMLLLGIGGLWLRRRK